MPSEDDRHPLTALPDDAPAGFRESLASRGAAVTRIMLDPPRTYVWAGGLGPHLFGWYSRAPEHAAMVEYEARVREVVGSELPLRTPPLIDRGELWRLDRAIDPEPLQGAVAVEAVVEAVQALAGLRLPPSPPSLWKERKIKVLRRRLRTLRSPLPARDFLRARSLVSGSLLPRTTSHGDFHRGHVLPEGGLPWVIDWEGVAMRPAGFDLMRMWADIERREDRDYLFEQAERTVGRTYGRELLKLRYALLVQAIATKFAEHAEYNRDPEGGRALLLLLPEVRREALAE